MGSTSIHVSQRGTTMMEAFETARREAEEEHGSDHYNGKINNADDLYDWTSRYNGKNLDKLSDEAFELSKGTAVGICLKKPKANKNKTKSTVERFPQKGTRKWVTMYVATTRWDGSNFVCEAKTLAECVKKARLYSEKTQETVNIDIVKRIEKGSDKCARITYKKSKTEELGHYVFFGRVSD